MVLNNHHYLLAGSIFVSRDSYWITTVLGSCVAICLYDTKNLFGGINHYMLPYWSGTGLASPKYGDIAVDKLIEEMLKNGSSKINLTAKLFGGAAVLDYNHVSLDIGMKNIRFAKEILQEHRIRIIGENTGGKIGRKIIYKTNTGEVYHKFLNKKQKTI